MRARRYDLYGVAAGLGLPLVGTVITAVVRHGGFSLGSLVAAHRGEPLLWIMDTAPFVLGALGWIITRQHAGLDGQAQEILKLEAQRREGFEKTASELFHAAQGLLGNVSAFTSTTAETAASVRETTATMSQLSQTATAAAITAETVVGLALESERAAAEGLETAEASSGELLKLAAEVRGLSSRIEGLNDKMRDIFDIASSVTYVADRSRELAAEAQKEADRAGSPGIKSVAAEMARHAEESRSSATRVKAILGDVHKAMVSALTAAEAGSRRAEGGAHVIHATADAIRRLSKALDESAHAAKEIARVAQQQENGIEQVMKAMNEIYVATQDTVTSTHEVAAGAKSLNELASTLRRSVKH
jgi:methyl-accepting chemotaxis protein